MKILILSDFFLPYGKGGAEMAAYRLAQGFLKKNHQIVVVTTVQDKNLAAREKYQGMAVYRFYAKYHQRWRAYLSLWNPRLLRKIKEVIEIEKPDIIHIHNIHYYFSYACLKLIRQMGLSSVLTIHDCMPICYKKFTCYINQKDFSNSPQVSYRLNMWRCFKCQRFRYFPLRNILIRYFLNRYADKVIAVSRELKILLESNGIKCDDFIYHGIKLDDFQINQSEVKDFQEKFNLINKKIVFFGGRLSYGKGIEHLIKAISLVAKQRDDVLLLVAGQKDAYTEELAALARELNIEKRIIFTDWLNERELLCAYTCTHLLVYPSLCFDTFGLMNLEAMIMKKPVITTCFGGSKEIVENELSGYVINPLNIEEMSKKILELLNNPTKAEKMGQAGYQRVLKNFTLNKEVNEYLKIFQKCLK